MTWFPGVGLIYNGGTFLLKYFGGQWTQLTNASLVAGTSNISEYSPGSNKLFYGGGSDNSYWLLDSSGVSEAVTAPPFTLGSAADFGIPVADPGSATIIAFDRAASGSWVSFDTSNPSGSWASLSASVGDGSSPQLGLPPLPFGSGAYASIACGIPASASIPHNVILFVEVLSGGTGSAWLYRHS